MRVTTTTKSVPFVNVFGIEHTHVFEVYEEEQLMTSRYKTEGQYSSYVHCDVKIPIYGLRVTTVRSSVYGVTDEKSKDYGILTCREGEMIKLTRKLAEVATGEEFTIEDILKQHKLPNREGYQATANRLLRERIERAALEVIRSHSKHHIF